MPVDAPAELPQEPVATTSAMDDTELGALSSQWDDVPALGDQAGDANPDEGELTPLDDAFSSLARGEADGKKVPLFRTAAPEPLSATAPATPAASTGYGEDRTESAHADAEASDSSTSQEAGQDRQRLLEAASWFSVGDES